MNHRKSQQPFEGIEIAIAMQQRVLPAKAERGDETIDRFPNGMAASAKRPIVSGRLARQVDTAGLEPFHFPQPAVDRVRRNDV